MNNEGGETLNLPPQPEAPPSGEQAQEQAVEQARPAAQEAGVGKRAPQPGSTATTDTPTLPQLPDTPAAPPADKQAAARPVSPVTADLPAHNADLIEKEWIQRAKSIIAHTHDDPHRQKSEMSRVKADYIRKRFNKTIKTDEASA